jgi:hypothetical protein
MSISLRTMVPAVAVALVVAAVGCASEDSTGPTGVVEETDAVAPSSATGAMKDLGLPETELGRTIADFMAMIETSDEPRAIPPQVSAVATEAARELVAAYRRLPVERQFDRWRVVRGIGLLRADVAAPDLLEMAMTETPAVRPAEPQRPHDHAGCQAASDQEGMIRMRAAEGLRAIAQSGGAEARRSLLVAMTAPSVSVRRTAVQGYLSLPGSRPTLLEDARNRLASEDQWMLSVRAGLPEEFTGTPDELAGESEPVQSVVQ